MDNNAPISTKRIITIKIIEHKKPRMDNQKTQPTLGTEQRTTTKYNKKYTQSNTDITKNQR